MQKGKQSLCFTEAPFMPDAHLIPPGRGKGVDKNRVENDVDHGSDHRSDHGCFGKTFGAHQVVRCQLDNDKRCAECNPLVIVPRILPRRLIAAEKSTRSSSV